MKKQYFLATVLGFGLVLGLATYAAAGTKTIEVGASAPTTPPVEVTVPGAMYGDLVNNNGNTTIDGNDQCVSDPQPPVPAIAYESGVSLGSHPAQVTTSSPAPVTELISPELDVDALAASFEAAATITTPQNPYGSPSNYVIAYIDATSARYQESNLEGYGVLVVKGDFKATAKLDWHGLIIVTGETDIAGGGSTGANIRGALISGGDVISRGNMNTAYDSCEIKSALQATSSNPMSYSVDRWRSR